MMTEYTTFDYVWRVVLNVESKDQRTHNSFQYILTENDKNRVLIALVGESNPICLKHFLLKSKNPAAANLKLHNADFMPDGRLRLAFETQTRNIALLQQYDVETCVYQCLKKNNCWDLLLCTEKGDVIYPEELLKDYKEQKDDTRQYCKPDKIKVWDFVWDVNLKKKTGALLTIKKSDIPIFRDILKEGLKQHANQSKNKTFELYEVSLEENEQAAKLIVTLNFLTDEKNILQTTIDTIEKWVSSSFKLRGHENVTIFYDEESAVEREVATNNPSVGVGADSDIPQTSSLSSTLHEKGLLQTQPITHSLTNVEVSVATEGALANTGQKTATKTSSHLSPDQTPPGTEKSSNAKSDETGGTPCMSIHYYRGVQASAGTDVDHPKRGGVTGQDQVQTCTKINSDAKPDKTDDASCIPILDSKGTQASAETDVDHPRRPPFQESQYTFVTIEWSLCFKEEYQLKSDEVTSCRNALFETLNDLLKEEKLLDVYVYEDCINVTKNSLTIKFAVGDLFCFPNVDVLSVIVNICFDKHRLNNITVRNGTEVARLPMQDSKKGSEIIFCLFLPEDLAKEIKSIELCVNSKEKHTKEMKRRDTMWRASMAFPEPKDDILYNYKLKIKKSVALFFSKLDEVVDPQRRTICWDYPQRDIISITCKPFQENDKEKGIVAHIKDIHQDPKFEVKTAFLEIDNLMSRNSLNLSHRQGALSVMLNEQITENICLILLHCIHKKYVSSAVSKNMNTASKIWDKVQHLGQESKDICVKFVGEIFQTYEAYSTTKCSPLHFINGTQSVLDITSLHKVLFSRSSFPLHNCSKSTLCLQSALKFILNQGGECKTLYDLVCLMFDCIPEREVLDGFNILKEFNAPEEKKLLKENVQKHVFANIKKIMAGKVRFSDSKAINDIISKAEGELRIALVLHCEMEIVSQIKNPDSFRYGFMCKDLEDICKENMLFQTIDQQILLLDAVLKMPTHVKPRNFIKYVLLNLQNEGFESARETLENAYEVLLGTVHGTSSEAELISYFEEYDSLSNKCFFQTNREHFDRRLQSYITKRLTSSMLKIHATVEHLQSATIDFYCQLLKGQLQNQTFLTKLDFLEKHWKNHLDTRNAATVQRERKLSVDHSITSYCGFWLF